MEREGLRKEGCWDVRREGADQANPHLKQTGPNCWEAQLFINGRHGGEGPVCVCV